MNGLQAVAMGVVQGLTEFLPISSSAHLVLVPHFLNWEPPSVAFDVFLHIGTLVAVISYFRREIARLFKAFLLSIRELSLKRDLDRRLAWLIVAGTIPAALLGFFFKDFFERIFLYPAGVSYLLIVTGILLWTTEIWRKQEKAVEKLNLLDGLIIGLAQAAAIVPGISRSGATISTGCLRGLSRESAAKFSFLLAVPITLLAGANKALEFGIGYPEGNFLVYFIGVVSAMTSGYLAIKYLLAYLRRGKLHIFAYYCWIVGIGSLLLINFMK